MSQKTIRIDHDIYSRLRDYSNKTGVPIAAALTEAAKKWLDEVAPGRLKALGRI